MNTIKKPRRWSRDYLQRMKKALERQDQKVSNNLGLPTQLFTGKDGVEPSPLSPLDRKLFRKYEQTINKGLCQRETRFFEVGTALETVQRKQLFKDYGYTGFDDYCRKRWGIARSQAYRLIDAARVMQMLSPIGDTMPCLPTRESQVRPLARLPLDVVRLIWRTVAEEAAGRRITAQRVARKVTEWKNGRRGSNGQSQGGWKEPIRINTETVRDWNRRIHYATDAVEDDRKDFALEVLGELWRELGEADCCGIRFRPDNGDAFEGGYGI